MNLKGTVQFNDCNIQNFKIQKDNHAGNYIFNNCKFNSLTFDRFNNYNGNFTLSTCESINYDYKSLISIFQSNLGKTQLFNVKLLSFRNIEIEDSQIMDLTTSNVLWFHDNDLNKNSEKKKFEEIESQNIDKKEKQRKINTQKTFNQYNKREIYRQLKQVCEKNGDRINALEFKSLEMNYYKNEISNAKWYDQDRIILLFSSTNNFGLNWWKPIIWGVGFAILLHLSMIPFNHSSQEWEINPCEANYDFKYFPKLFNPTRAIGEGFVGILDVLQRITLLFFTFQTVSAFRKFIK